jgi:hypothetical protein
MMKHDKKIQR